MRHGPWVHLIPVLIYTALGDVIFTREICSPETFGGLQPIQGNPHKYRQCSGSGVVWIVPCQPGTLFDPVDRVCRNDPPGRGMPGKKYRPKPNSAIGGTQRPPTETTDAEEFLFTTRRPRPVKGNRIKGGQRIRTTTRAPVTLASLRPRPRTTISPRHQTISIDEYSTIRPKPAFTPPQSRIRSTTPRPLLATPKSMSTTRKPWTTATRRPVFSQTTTIDYKTAEEIEMSIDVSDEAIPTVGYRKTTTGSPPVIGNSVEEDYPDDEDEDLATTTEISIITTPTSLWVQPSTEHASTVFKPLPPSVHPRLPPETPIRPLSQGKLGPLNSRVTSPRQPPPFAPPGARPPPIHLPKTVVIEKPRTTTPVELESFSVENLNSLEVISGEVIPTTTQFPTLLTYPPYIYEKGKQSVGDIKAGELDEKSIETTHGLSLTDRQFLKELMEMVRSQKTAEEAAHRIEKERQRQIFEKMALGRPIIVPPRNSAETLSPQTYATGWTHVPDVDEIEPATPAGHIQTTKSAEKPYTKVHPYPDNVPAPLRPIYPGFSTPDIIRFTTQPPIDIIRFTPSPINIDNAVGKEEKWVTSSLSWKPPPDFEKETETATTLTLLTGCVIGTSCPLLGDSELLCEHPSRPSLYLQCVPTSFQGGIWTERACPDTLVFIGDRCDKPDIRESLLAAGQPVIAVSEPPSGTPIPIQQLSPITTTQPSIVLTTMTVPYIENNEVGRGDYLQWQRIGVPTVRQPSPKQPQMPKFPPSTPIKNINSFGNRENEMIDYSQVFPLFPMVRPSFLSPRNLNALQLRRRPTYYYGGRQPALLRPIYDAPYQHGNLTVIDEKTKENEKTVKEDFIVDKVVKPALRKIAFNTSKGLVEMLMVKPVHQMDTFIAKRIEEMKSREMNGTETQGHQ